jgi:riboflavin kinase/FMN adenylyltransferase
MQSGFEVARMDSVSVDGVRVSSTAVRELLAAGDLDGAARLLGVRTASAAEWSEASSLARVWAFLPPICAETQSSRAVGHFRGRGDWPLRAAAARGREPRGAPDVWKAGTGVEVHIFDFARELYGEHLQVRFLSKLRDEEKYPDMDALRLQIARDVEAAARFFRATRYVHRDELTNLESQTTSEHRWPTTRKR